MPLGLFATYAADWASQRNQQARRTHRPSVFALQATASSPRSQGKPPLAASLDEERGRLGFKQLKELRDRGTHRRFLDFVLTKDVHGKAEAFLNYPDPSDPLMSLAHAGKPAVPHDFQALLDEVDPFVPGALSPLLALMEAPGLPVAQR